jgi:tRNA G10  N-methylase Trm11
MIDFFGNEIVENALLRDKFIEPPFSVLNTQSGSWQNRKRQWGKLGIKSEVGRGDNLTFKDENMADVDMYRTAKKVNGKKVGECMPTSLGEKYGRKPMNGTSIFDPALCEVLYHWFCPKGGKILDPFAGGSVRGIVANYLGFNYTGIDIRPEQVQSNIDQGKLINDALNQPVWHCGDSNLVMDDINETFDFVFSCPPYADLEVYSDLPGDISNMPYAEFLALYRSIIKKSCDKLKPGGYACFVVGEVRDKKGHYIGFVPDTIKAFTDSGVKFYNEAILLNSIGTATIRANNSMKNDKLVKIHQNVLVFKKP